MTKKFYITTPIYYPSGNLHIGHVYTTVLADILKRYKKMLGYETFFLTGSDEHGQKIENKAKEQNKEPLQYLDEIINNFKNLWEKMNISFDKFIRTSDKEHVSAVQKIFSNLLDKEYIYKGQYKGEYCVSCEEYLTKDQIDQNGLCLISQTKPILINEETYFLKTSSFNDYIKELLNTNFLIPKYRNNELLKNFVEKGINDLSISRTTFKWGIPIIEDTNHIIYVWLDALTNYITALGYKSDNKELFNKFWDKDTEIVQLLGKEITRFHAIYWPIILKMLNLRLPNKLIAHGWILNKDTKMSKSLNNVVDPNDIIDKYTSDALRFYIANELSYDKDGNFTEDLFIESFNTNLSNNIGNLISRVNNMIIKYFDGQINDEILNDDFENIRKELIENYTNEMNEYNISSAVKLVLSFSNKCNKYIEDTAPWSLDLNNIDEVKKLKEILCTLRRNILTIILLLKPVLVNSYNKMLNQIGTDENNISFEDVYVLNNIKFKKLEKDEREIIFKRIVKN